MSPLKIEISDELIFARHANGVKLYRPTQIQSRLAPTVKEIFSGACNLYFFHGDSLIVKNNETNANLCGYDSEKQLNGKRLHEIPWLPKACAFSTIQNNQQVMQSNRILVLDEEITLFELNFQFLSIKLPWYNELNQIIGVFGCSVVFDKPSIAHPFGKIIQALFNLNEVQSIKAASNHCILEAQLTKREHDSLELVMMGKTAKEIGIALNLSTRTIEKYLENIKQKMHVKTKSELIEKALTYYGIR